MANLRRSLENLRAKDSHSDDIAQDSSEKNVASAVQKAPNRPPKFSEMFKMRRDKMRGDVDAGDNASIMRSDAFSALTEDALRRHDDAQTESDAGFAACGPVRTNER
jgi:hypothetical protein